MAESNTIPTTPSRKRKLPVHWNHLLTERSILFYDGTYRWNGMDGFWDEHGIYHEFNDPNDPEGYPPTPHPVGLWLEEEEEWSETGDGSEAGNASEAIPKMLKHTKDKFTLDGMSELTSPSWPSILANLVADSETSMLINGKMHKKTSLRDDVFLGHPDRERLLGQIEGMLVGKHMVEKKLCLEDAYKFCGMRVPTALLVEVGNRASVAASKSHEAQTETVVEQAKHMSVEVGEILHCDPDVGTIVAQETPLEGSPLSDCPSSLSDWEV